MKKIGIITLNGYFNYGNRLQNYALQEILKSMNYEVETLIIKNKNEKSKRIINRRSVKNIIKKIIFSPRIIQNKKYQARRTEKFKDFSRKYINESSYFISDNNIPTKEIESFDFFIVGSDQVWNPLYNMGSSLYFLTFAPKSKRISYAASFGISEIPEEYVEEYREWLDGFSSISVREEAGVDIIKEITGQLAKVVLDPTLLLSKEEWLSISKNSSKKPNNKYLLTYFLGTVSKENNNKIHKLAKKENLKIVNLSNVKDKQAFTSDPSEFIDYISSSEIFLTDSFHGSVFSILLEKPFIVFEREGSKKSMNSRLDTLLRTFDLENRKWEKINGDSDIFNINYSRIRVTIKAKREKSLAFIKSALNDS